MSARDDMANLGNELVRISLRSARRVAEGDRKYSTGPNRYMQAWFAGKLSVADIYLNADPLLLASAQNEINFLLGEYQK